MKGGDMKIIQDEVDGLMEALLSDVKQMIGQSLSFAPIKLTQGSRETSKKN